MKIYLPYICESDGMKIYFYLVKSGSIVNTFYNLYKDRNMKVLKVKN